MEQDSSGTRAQPIIVRILKLNPDVESTLTMSVKKASVPTITLLLDSGADCSLIKLHIPNEETPVDLNKKVILHGITANGIDSLGTCHLDLEFNGQTYRQEFQVVSSTFPLLQDGILGRDFLKGTEANLDYRKNSVELFGKFSYPMNATFIKEIPTIEISQAERAIIDNRVEQLASLMKTIHLEEEEIEPLMGLVKKYNDIFFLEGDKLRFTSTVEHIIDTLDSAGPVNVRPYRVAEMQRQEIERQVEMLAEQGLIRASRSQWNSPLLLVKKRTDDPIVKKWRLCVDYRKLNEITKKIVTPIPRIADILEKLGRSRWYSTLDLASGYWQVPIRDKDRCKTAFTAGNKSYEWLRCPFGLTTAPGTFVELMRVVLEGLENVLTYLDDIVVFSNTLEEHIVALDRVFERMRAHNLQLQPAKCSLLLSEVTYLGHKITREGILIDERNVQVVKDFPIPKTPKQVRSYLGFINYYRGFIKDCAQHALPLTELTRKNVKFRWTEECQQAMDYLSSQVITPPILKPPDFDKEFMLRTDASNSSMGGVLSQGEIGVDNPVGFFSKRLDSAQMNYSVIEREMLAIVKAIEYFRVYLLHRRFRLITDHNPLVYIRASVPQNSRLMRWRLSLEEYDFYIQHQAGKLNQTADFLSRLHEDESFIPIQTVEVKNIRVITRAQKKKIEEELVQTLDPELDKVKQVSEIVDQVQGMDPMSYSYDSFVDLVNRVPLINHKVIEQTKKCVEKAPKVRVEFCARDILDILHVPSEESVMENDPRIVSIKSRKGGKLLLTHKDKKTDRLDYAYVFEAIKLLVQYCHANGIQEVQVDVSDTIIFPLQYRIVLNMFKFLALNSDMRINLFRSSVIVIDNKERTEEILKEFHSDPLGGHQGIKRSLLKIQQKYSWESMSRDVKNYVRNCELCQKIKHFGGVRQPMQITTTATRPWQRLAVDIVGPLPQTYKGNKYLLTAQDELTKFLFAIPLPNQTAEEIAKALTENVLLVYGSPDSILSDQGANFMSEVFRNTCKFFKAHKIRTTAFHPMTNGGLERSHLVLKDYLRTFSGNDSQNWDEWVKAAVFTYNTSENASTKFTPFNLLYGWEPRIPFGSHRAPEVVYNYSNYLADLKNKLQNAHAVARESILKAKEISKGYYDKNVKQREFEVGAKVLLSCKETKTGLDPRWKGPYTIVEVPTLVNTVLKDKNGKITRVNNNRIKPYFSLEEEESDSEE